MDPTEDAPLEPAAPPTRMFRILSRWTGALRFELECESLRVCLEAAVAVKADLRDANLGGANLGGADLGGADLGGANLGGADLYSANLRDANLGGANLGDADLGGAELRDADLRDANLCGANLCGANLCGANLRGANLGGADMRNADLRDANLGGADMRNADLRDANLGGADLGDANLRPIRADLYDVLVTARDEAPAFLTALREGRVDGSAYLGECACLVGTIANVRGVDVNTLPKDPYRPIESFMKGVRKGDTPETNQIAKLVAEWTAAFIGEPVP